MKRILAMIKFKNPMLMFLVLGMITSSISAQNAETHNILNEKLKKSSFKKLVKAGEKADVILFGEIHNDPISHWLAIKLLKALNSDDVIIGLEMFERDNQKALNDYLEGNIDLEILSQEARLWSNYDTDYAPLVDYAKEQGIKISATNIPRRYASIVYKEGFGPIESLVDEEKVHIAPLPIPYDPNLPGYKNMLSMVEGHGGENFPKSQAIKDATMADSIVKALDKGGKLFHINGKYHSDNKEGIVWYLQQYAPELKVITISVAMEGEKVEPDVADFIIKVDRDMIKTYK